MKIVRSIVAVAAGLVTIVVLVVALTWVSVEAFLEGDITIDPTPTFMGISLAYTFFAAVVGGWGTARIAWGRPMLHAAALAAAVLVLGLLGAHPAGASAPGWYAPVVGVLGLMGALTGGWMCVLAPAPAPPVDSPGS